MEPDQFAASGALSVSLAKFGSVSVSSAVRGALSFAGSGSAGVDVEFVVSGCSEFVRSGAEELTDSGGGGARILDGEEGTDLGGCVHHGFWALRALPTRRRPWRCSSKCLTVRGSKLSRTS